MIRLIEIISSSYKVDAHEEQHEAGHKEFSQFAIIFLVLTYGHQKYDDSKGAEDTSEERVLGKIIADNDSVEELNSDDREEEDDEPIDQLHPF